jgi:murein DD-endopeptidase MepM/ murein hydrolase activator NlpD
LYTAQIVRTTTRKLRFSKGISKLGSLSKKQPLHGDTKDGIKALKFPRTHLFLVIVLSFGLCSFVIAKFTDNAVEDRFSTDQVLLELPNIDEATLPPPVELDTSLPAVVEPLVPAKPEHNWTQISTKVKPGDSLAVIFKRNGLSAKDVHLVSTSKPLGSRLKNIFPGHEMTFYVDEAKRLMRLAYSTGPLDRFEFERNGNSFNGEQITAEPERVLAYKHGTIDHSLFVASQRAGLSDALTMKLAQIFQWDIDFVLDIRPGDQFYVVFEELFHNDEFVGYGDILAAEFVNQGDVYRGIQYTAEGRDPDYYAPSGDSMRKAFLRAPVEFSRISSNFNLRRLHPLFKTVRPHRGIDYAAPSGTPILAAGDGKVKAASRSKANGNYVVIQHGEQFVTKYLHLSKFGRNIKAGKKVQQGQVIGYVGATGWATAAHLHYEFLVNGVHQNPRTVSLPNAAPVPKSELPFFKAHTQQYAALLDNYKNQVSVALAR